MHIRLREVPLKIWEFDRPRRRLATTHVSFHYRYRYYTCYRYYSYYSYYRTTANTATTATTDTTASTPTTDTTATTDTTDTTANTATTPTTAATATIPTTDTTASTAITDTTVYYTNKHLLLIYSCNGLGHLGQSYTKYYPMFYRRSGHVEIVDFGNQSM